MAEFCKQCAHKYNQQPDTPPLLCEGCGKTISNQSIINMTQKTTSKTIKGCAILVIIACLAVIGFIFFASPDVPDDDDIKEVARTYIIKSVRDPKGLEFFHDSKVTTSADSVYTYQETIKSLNGFGLKVAANAVVQLKWNGNDPDDVNNYEVKNINLENR